MGKTMLLKYIHQQISDTSTILMPLFLRFGIGDQTQMYLLLQKIFSRFDLPSGRNPEAQIQSIRERLSICFPMESTEQLNNRLLSMMAILKIPRASASPNPNPNLTITSSLSDESDIQQQVDNTDDTCYRVLASLISFDMSIWSTWPRPSAGQC
jgi:hypothetical protein